MKPIDLRSDTVTHPTNAMRNAMAEAEVGDDVLDEDPTLHHLQKSAAKKMKKEDALFVPSGTMGNLISVLTHCGRGDEIILGDRSHIFLNEVGGISALGGIHPRIVPNQENGTLSLGSLENAIRHSDLHYPPTRLVCLENTHNYCFGAALTPKFMKEVAGITKKYGLKIHLDGARIFNAATALSVSVADLARHADSVMFCLSKGLSAPVGSIICGSEEFVSHAKKIRKMVGGGMRQAGHLAAAGLVALEQMLDRIKEDHQNARKLARGLTEIRGIQLQLDKVQTNIIFFTLQHPRVTQGFFQQELESRGIKLLTTEPGIFRAVLHREISEEHIGVVLEAVRSILT